MKKLKLQEIKKHNLDVWALIFRRGKINISYERFLSTFEYQIRSFYFSYYEKTRKRIKKVHKWINIHQAEEKHIMFMIFLKRKRFGLVPNHWDFRFFIRNEDVVHKYLATSNKKFSYFYNKFKLQFLQRRFLARKLKLNPLITQQEVFGRKLFNYGGKIYRFKRYRLKSGRKFFLSRFIKKNRKSYRNWMFDLSEQKRFLYFYGFFTKKKFINFYKINRLRVKNSLFLILEFTLINFLFRLGFFLTSMEVNLVIDKGFVTVNNKVITNTHFLLKLNDNISFTKPFRQSLFTKIKKSLKSKIMILNIPPYIEVDYRILTYSLWRLPQPSELPSFYQFPFYRIPSQSIV